ncbi:MAG: hypothetical protein U1F52_00570 [Burkholderiales bacterium]
MIPVGRHGVVLLLASVVAGAAQAADWDHDANIAAGVHDLVETFRSAGVEAMATLVGGCYDRIAEHAEVDERLRQLEYCAGMDLAAVRIARTEERAMRGEPDFFGAPQVVSRVGRLSEFLADPNVGNQIIRAWSAASGEALAREGF